MVNNCGLLGVINDIVEPHCYVVITSESILMSKYIAESIIFNN